MPHGQKPLSVMYFVILFKFYGIIILPDVPFCCVWWSKPAAHLRSGCVRLGSCGLPCSRCAFATLPSSKPKCRIPDRIEIWQGNLPKASRNYHKLHDYINVGVLVNLNVQYLSLITWKIHGMIWNIALFCMVVYGSRKENRHMSSIACEL